MLLQNYRSNSLLILSVSKACTVICSKFMLMSHTLVSSTLLPFQLLGNYKKWICCVAIMMKQNRKKQDFCVSRYTATSFGCNCFQETGFNSVCFWLLQFMSSIHTNTNVHTAPGGVKRGRT